MVRFLPSDMTDTSTVGRLAITRSIVRYHRGWLAIETGADQGTRIDVYLPAASHEAPSHPPIEREPLTGDETVLIADSNVMIVALLRTTLSTRGYRVLTATHRLSPEIIDNLVAQFGTLQKIVRAHKDDLVAVAGVGEVLAERVRASLNLLRNQLELERR